MPQYVLASTTLAFVCGVPALLKSDYFKTGPGLKGFSLLKTKLKD